MGKQKELTQKSKMPYWVYEIDRFLNVNNKKSKGVSGKNKSPRHETDGKKESSS